MDEEYLDIVVVGDDLLIDGFRLAGIKKYYKVSDEKEAEELLSKLLGQTDISIIIILDKFLEKMDWRIKKRIELTAKPIVVAIPSKDGPIEEEISLAKLIKRALGFDILNSESNK